MSIMRDLQRLPVPAWIGVGMAVLGIGLGCQGIGSCIARLKESDVLAQSQKQEAEAKKAEAELEEKQYLVREGLITKENLAETWFADKEEDDGYSVAEFFFGNKIIERSTSQPEKGGG